MDMGCKAKGDGYRLQGTGGWIWAARHRGMDTGCKEQEDGYGLQGTGGWIWAARNRRMDTGCKAQGDGYRLQGTGGWIWAARHRGMDTGCKAREDGYEPQVLPELCSSTDFSESTALGTGGQCGKNYGSAKRIIRNTEDSTFQKNCMNRGTLA
ncbi:hypothetical protein WISP_73233 [Willisornis vidua]|uniref:Uncharacterized protein n=1 Tax=Willisornis vidua TaxID=1566151 RepID=A0ABQ9DBE7_9PASS|nr:hypothetical protein WISP_73233 [Willisornis vidua]